jgi:hypothetical protein
MAPPREFAFNSKLFAYDTGRDNQKSKQVLIRIRKHSHNSRDATQALATIAADESDAGREWSNGELNIGDPGSQDKEISWLW